MRISDWSSDVCSSDLHLLSFLAGLCAHRPAAIDHLFGAGDIFGFVGREIEGAEGAIVGPVKVAHGDFRALPRIGLCRDIGLARGFHYARPDGVYADILADPLHRERLDTKNTY